MEEGKELANAALGLPILTERDVAICMAMSQWIATARKFGGVGYGEGWLPGYADIVKSRLFWRIRSGKKPLPEPPPTAYSCPWYELIEEAERPHWCYELHTDENHAYIAQCRYDVIERGEDGKPTVVGFRSWRFKVWHGDSPHNNSRQGWWLQLQPAIDGRGAKS